MAAHAEGHVFAGLEGLAQTLLPRQTSRLQPPSPPREHAQSAPTRLGRGLSGTWGGSTAPRARTSAVRAGGVVGGGTTPGTSVGRAALLREMSVHADTFTLVHDLYTPNRSYIFSRGDAAARRPEAFGRADEQRVRQRRIRQYEDKLSRHKERLKGLRPPVTRTSRAVLTSSSTPMSRALMREGNPHSSLAPSAESSMLALLGLTDEDLPNELAGPFTKKSRMAVQPAVKQVTTFEDYLERTVNEVRATPVRFNKSFRRLDRGQFRPSGTRSAAFGGAHDPISLEVTRRAERAATSLGFAPSREVVSMHRQRPHWQVDPAIYVRACMEN